MTTTITVKTHDWPVRVSINDHHDHRDNATGSYSYGQRTESSVVVKNSEQSFYLTNTRSISFSELPADWTPESEGACAVNGLIGSAPNAT